MIEPDQKAVQTVLSIMDRRAKLLGMNVDRVDIAITGAGDTIEVVSSLAGQAAGAVSDGSNSKDESLQLLELMASSGVLDENIVTGILSGVNEDDIIDAEVVEESE
jgi:hypothetical protein